jgi:uncharacterized protein (UPF0548 family)
VGAEAREAFFSVQADSGVPSVLPAVVVGPLFDRIRIRILFMYELDHVYGFTTMALGLLQLPFVELGYAT